MNNQQSITNSLIIPGEPLCTDKSLHTNIVMTLEKSFQHAEAIIENRLSESLESTKKEFSQQLIKFESEISNSKFYQKTLENKINQIKFNIEHIGEDISFMRNFMNIRGVYADYPNDKLLERLCDILANITITPNSELTILRIALFEAINTAKLVTTNHLRLLAFIFLIRNCKFKSINCRDSFCFFCEKILWKFKPEHLSNHTLAKHLEFSRCTTFVNREATIEKMLVNTYLPAIQNTTPLAPEKHLTTEMLFDSVVECLNLNAIPETSKLSNQFIFKFNLNQREETEEEQYRRKNYYSSRKGQENVEFGKIVNRLLNELESGNDIQQEWAESPIKNHVLTPVGMVLAIAFIRQELKINLPYGQWIY